MLHLLFSSALEDFNNGVVLTNRPLRANELFEVRLDKMVSKWAGSIEIGVTTYSPTELEYPATMTNIRYIFQHFLNLIFIKVGPSILYIFVIQIRNLDDDRKGCDAKWNHCY